MTLPPTTPAGGTPIETGVDPSMDDILASIRRILNDEEKAAKEAGPPEGVLVLDPSMLVSEPTPPSPPAAAPSIPVPPEPPMLEAPAVPAIPIVPETAMTVLPAEPAPDAGEHLVAPEAAAAAASSLGTLMRTLASERGTAVYRGGPTIEDLVREEVRPLLKEWLDTHLPPLVERLVRAEIERVVSRTAS